jgi:hypothetical protein
MKEDNTNRNKRILTIAVVLIVAAALIAGLYALNRKTSAGRGDEGPDKGAGVRLERDDWSDDVKTAVNDLLTTCGYYGYTDPLSLLGALFATRGIEWAYILSDFLRLYLAGVCFGLYACRVGSRDGWATACASAVVYIQRGNIVPGIACPVMIGVLFGALTGARLLKRLDVRTLRQIFCIAILMVAANMIYQGFTGGFEN